MIQDSSPSSTRTPIEVSFTPTGHGTGFRSISGERCTTDTCSFGELAGSISGGSTFRSSRPEPQASVRSWAALLLRGVVCSSPITRTSRWRRSPPMSRCRRSTSESGSCLYRLAFTTVGLSSCMSLREPHHRESLGMRFLGARPNHAVPRDSKPGMHGVKDARYVPD